MEPDPAPTLTLTEHGHRDLDGRGWSVGMVWRFLDSPLRERGGVCSLTSRPTTYLSRQQRQQCLRKDAEARSAEARPDHPQRSSCACGVVGDDAHPRPPAARVPHDVARHAAEHARPDRLGATITLERLSRRRQRCRPARSGSARPRPGNAGALPSTAASLLAESAITGVRPLCATLAGGLSPPKPSPSGWSRCDWSRPARQPPRSCRRSAR